MYCTITIDNREWRVKEGSNLLWIALDNGIYIPNICSLKEMSISPASCRLCLVEIDGVPAPVTACTEKTIDGMKVTTNSSKIKRLRQFSFDLLLSRHHLDCGHCIKNRRCTLQEIARHQHFKMQNKTYRKLNLNYPIDDSHPLIIFDRNKCVLCGKCVYICHEKGTGVLDFAYRGIDTRVSTFADMPLAETECNSCLNCVNICPVGSLYLKIKN